MEKNLHKTEVTFISYVARSSTKDSTVAAAMAKKRLASSFIVIMVPKLAMQTDLGKKDIK